MTESTTSCADEPAGDIGRSVYQRALGPEFASLDTHLQRYFGPIPPGWEGAGSGRYDVAGSRFRFLRPILAMMASRNVLFPELGHDVPFTVTNLPGSDGSLRASRTFEFRHRTRVMEDSMTVRGGRLVDRLGKRGGLEVTIRLAVVAGGLRMTSTRLALRARRVRIPLPPIVTMRLDERTDSADPSRQRVDVRIRAAGMGEVFRYAGTFTYAVLPRASTGGSTER